MKKLLLVPLACMLFACSSTDEEYADTILLNQEVGTLHNSESGTLISVHRSEQSCEASAIIANLRSTDKFRRDNDQYGKGTTFGFERPLRASCQ
ncbi:hypothetical protein [Alteromonas sp. KUL49]|uniref:hypothetical protein n=1 Tax=Alteromonas sp. KUL49 TaxID=2480798 RepID=UPI00102F2500|nr:hypothetical protein [Alteromonas sp. KUL49]TAP36816.1 hypothetical protein EYS00_16985 [Alteromonas sp. KUL49]GEA13070.1 hypothetical protein KUL49_34450 [Alteromonas sp. KUL49]